MFLSKSCEYGIRASLYLAAVDDHGFVSIRKVSEDLQISFHFLTKVFRRLTRAGLMHSFKGPNGGISLARSPHTIRLLDIILAIDGERLFNGCVLGLPGCGRHKPCPLHNRWNERREGLYEMFECITLADIAGDYSGHTFRLTGSTILG